MYEDIKVGKFQSLFYWIIYSYSNSYCGERGWSKSFNPYFTGLSILILAELEAKKITISMFQSLFYWIIYSYNDEIHSNLDLFIEFQSLFYWIIYSYSCSYSFSFSCEDSFNPYFTGLSILILIELNTCVWSVIVSILILLDYLFL